MGSKNKARSFTYNKALYKFICLLLHCLQSQLELMPRVYKTELCRKGSNNGYKAYCFER